MNRGKIFKIDTGNNFKIKYGTVNNKDIKSVFINLTSWVSLVDDYSKNNFLINKLRKRIQTILHENVNKDIFIGDLFIIDLDIRESGLKNSIQTFMSLDVNLYLKKNNLTFKDEILVKELEDYIDIIKNELNNYEDFNFIKNKKKEKALK